MNTSTSRGQLRDDLGECAVVRSGGIGEALRGGLATGRDVALDSTLLAAWSRHDPDAAWSYPSKHHGRVFGYKVHVLLDRFARLPLFFLISPANRNDLPFAYPLLGVARFLLGLPLRVVRDPQGVVRLDPTGKANGRGAYVCATKDCIGLIARALDPGSYAAVGNLYSR